jgi:RNA polymerase subunit RPABC4/transcription elongation factor Spt4
MYFNTMCAENVNIHITVINAPRNPGDIKMHRCKNCKEPIPDDEKFCSWNCQQEYFVLIKMVIISNAEELA